MAVSIVWSLTNGGSAISGSTDLGNLSNGANTTAKEIFIRHNGSNSITSAGIFIREFSGTYLGARTAAADFTEILAWGDGTTANSFGGLQINMKRDQPSNTFDTAAWPTYSSKAPSSGKGNTFRTGVGDDESNPITILSSTGATANGTIQAGSTPNVSFQLRIAVPSEEDTLGIRHFETVLTYSFTS